MFVEEFKLRGVTTRMATFKDVDDFCDIRMRDKYAMARHLRPDDIEFYGGTLADFEHGCRRGDLSYARRSEELVDKFSNLAIEEVSHEMVYNDQFGVLDYEAAVNGEPMCVFGPAPVESAASPVSIYVDNWTQADVPASEVQMRGVAVLALARAVSVFRPVNVYLIGAGGYSPQRMSWLQKVPVPTNPMDLARAAWMLGSPMMVRIGYFGNMHAIMKNEEYCSIPTMFQGREWQREKLGEWLAKREGLSHDVVFLPLMDTRTRWNTQERCVRWVTDTLAGLLENNA